MATSDYVVLSRKYRPKKLSDLIGQEVLAESLKNCIDSHRVPHAFLFYGIRGVGKTTTARILARCLNCLGAEGKGGMTSSPCGVCKSCQAMDTGSHLDVMEIDAASRTGVDDIREIIDASQYMPVMGHFKIFIIDEVHMLSKSAFNALLKTLEEPPSHVKFIFATTEINKIPETILSRCMVFNLKPIANEVITSHLLEIASKEGYALDPAAADLIASEADGSVRDSLSLLDQAIMLCLGLSKISRETVENMIGGVRLSEIEELVERILQAKIKEALELIDEILSKGSEINIVCKSIQTVLYKKIAQKVLNKEREYPLSLLLYAWQLLIKQTSNLKYSQYPEQVLKAAIVIMSFSSSFPNLDPLSLSDKTEKTSDKTGMNSLVAKTLEQPTEEDKETVNAKLLENILKYFPGSTVSEIE